MGKKYSDWLKIDLHIHTDWSKKTKENDYKGNFSIPTLKQKLTQNGVQIFSLTDHNIINIDAYKEYYEAYNEETDPLLLIGVELDIVVKSGATDKTYHSLLIFNNPCIEYAKDISQRLEDKYTELSIAEKERQLTIDEIVTIFPEDDFFFIPHAGNTKSIVDAHEGSIEDAQKMVLLMQSAFEKVKEKARQKYNEGFDKFLVEKFQNKDDHAYIEFTDNHNIEKYPCPNKGDDDRTHDFYYVKGGKNFETLRLAFIDPKSRIKSTSGINEINKISNFIEGIIFEGDTMLMGNKVSFSPHLNVLIGGRSSGKSLMMTILGDKIDSITIDKSRYRINYDKIKIKTKLDSNYSNVASLQKDDIIFITQGQIVKYFEERKLSDLANESSKSEEYKFAKSKFTEHKRSLEALIDDLKSSFQSCEENASKRYVLHSSTIDSILNKNFILTFDSNSILDDTDNSKQIEETKKIVESLNKDVPLFRDSKVLEFQEEEKKVIADFIDLVNSKREVLQKKEDRNSRKDSFVNSVTEVIEEKNKQLNAEAQQKTESKKLRQKLLSDCSTIFSNSVNLKSACDNLENFDYSLTQEVEINQSVKLVLEVEGLVEQTIKSSILDGINNCENEKSIYLNSLGLLSSAKSIKNYDTINAENLEKKIRRQLKEIFDKLDDPKDYLKYSDGETSKKNSPGYNSEKYLEIILKNSKAKVVFIDQPEDNLGNKFISENLVEMIREIKFQKQIFLVTHNPSIVVYGDSENVVIASNDDGRISYKQVVLENEDSQKDICHILDGGEYIFDMRAKKYNIRRILKEPKNG